MKWLEYAQWRGEQAEPQAVAVPGTVVVGHSLQGVRGGGRGVCNVR